METQVTANSAPSTHSELPAISLASTSFWCQTKATVEEIDFEWTIERFAFFADGGTWEPFVSAEFSNNCRLSINLSGDCQNVKIKLHYPADFALPIKVTLAISNEKCKKVFQKKTSIPPNTKSPVTVFEVNKITWRDSGDFVNGDVTIYFKIGYLKRNVLEGKATATERYLHKTPTRDNNQDHILHQLEELFEKMPLSDVTFNTNGRNFAAHKNILAMRSPVFAAMFLHHTKEMQTGEVEVEDVDPDVFQEVLRYLYTGLTRSTAMDVMAPGLLAAADKYSLDHLKTLCETHLIRQMSAKNCLDLLTLTTHHPAEHLKKFAIEYFRRYPSDVMETDNWKKMKEENPAVLFDLQQMVLTAPTV